MQSESEKIAILFPGQGSQYISMGASFYRAFPEAKRTFDEAEELLQEKLTEKIFQGSEEELRRTSNSQVAIFVTSVAVFRALSHSFPLAKMDSYAGLSLGEYSALVAAGIVAFDELLPIVAKRGKYMEEACERRAGGMAVLLGAEQSTVEALVAALSLSEELVIANYNCPGQLVLSGSRAAMSRLEAVAGDQRLKFRALNVQGAFHSPLMRPAQDQLRGEIEGLRFSVGAGRPLVMNVPGDYVSDIEQMRHNLIEQVVAPVRWEQGVRQMAARGVGKAIEMGCGKVLSGFCRRIAPNMECISIDKVEEIGLMEKLFSGVNHG